MNQPYRDREGAAVFVVADHSLTVAVWLRPLANGTVRR